MLELCTLKIPNVQLWDSLNSCGYPRWAAAEPWSLVGWMPWQEGNSCVSLEVCWKKCLSAKCFSVSGVILSFEKLFWQKNSNYNKLVYLSLCNIPWWQRFIFTSVKVMSPPCKGHGQQLISDSTPQLLVSSAQKVFTSVPRASLLWPWQVAMHGRMKMEVSFIRSSKSSFLPALDHAFFPKSMEYIIHTLWPQV